MTDWSVKAFDVSKIPDWSVKSFKLFVTTLYNGCSQPLLTTTFLDQRQSIRHNSIQLFFQRCLTSFKGKSRTGGRLHRLQNFSSFWKLVLNIINNIEVCWASGVGPFLQTRAPKPRLSILWQDQEIWGHDQHCS
jgi:hypothetical protein